MVEGERNWPYFPLVSLAYYKTAPKVQSRKVSIRLHGALMMSDANIKYFQVTLLAKKNCPALRGVVRKLNSACVH
jgi:hypothetical protein